MRHQCHGGKWSEDEVQAKSLCKHETIRWTNAETYRSSVRAPICENLLRISRFVSKGTTIGATQEKLIIKKNIVSMTLDASKGQNKNMMFYLKAKRYAPEVQEPLTNIPENKIETNDKKEEWHKKLGLSS